MRKLLLFFVIVLFQFTLAPRSGQACQCELATPAAEYEWADAVFSGIVFSIEPASDPNYLEVLVIVTASWKGVTTALINVYTNASDAACLYVFDVGVEYLIYAAGSANPCCQGVWTSMCNRTMPLYAAQGDLEFLGPPGTVPAELSTWGGIKALFE